MSLGIIPRHVIYKSTYNSNHIPKSDPYLDDDSTVSQRSIYTSPWSSREQRRLHFVSSQYILSLNRPWIFLSPCVSFIFWFSLKVLHLYDFLISCVILLDLYVSQNKLDNLKGAVTSTTTKHKTATVRLNRVDAKIYGICRFLDTNHRFYDCQPHSVERSNLRTREQSLNPFAPNTKDLNCNASWWTKARIDPSNLARLRYDNSHNSPLEDPSTHYVTDSNSSVCSLPSKKTFFEASSNISNLLSTFHESEIHTRISIKNGEGQRRMLFQDKIDPVMFMVVSSEAMSHVTVERFNEAQAAGLHHPCRTCHSGVSIWYQNPWCRTWFSINPCLTLFRIGNVREKPDFRSKSSSAII